MAVDHPHGGGEDVLGMLMRKLRDGAHFFSSTILAMASTEDDERLGGVFVLFDAEGREIDVWPEGDLSSEDYIRFYGHASNKCKAAHKAGVVCSGMVTTPPAITENPVYDGCIRLENGWYLAFSGFRAVLDRTYCILVAQYAKLLEMPGRRYNTIMVKSPDEALVRGLIHSAMFITFGHEFKTILDEAGLDKSD